MLEPVYQDILKAFLPELILAGTVLFVLLFDLGWLSDAPMSRRRAVAGGLSFSGCLAAFFLCFRSQLEIRLSQGMLNVDSLSLLLVSVILVLTGISILLAIESLASPHVGEFFSIILLATIGLLILVSSENMLMIFLGMELTSLSLYILTAFDKRRVQSIEAALKYFLFGGLSAAVLLFGLSLIYSTTGETDLKEVYGILIGRGPLPIGVLGMIMVIVGFGFKIAAVPFHFWTPETYEGAPVPSVAFIASVSKVAGFMVTAKFLLVGLFGMMGSAAWYFIRPGWAPILAVMAAFSMVLGNFAAIRQVGLRRLLAYSAIAHSGYMLLGIISQNSGARGALIYYVTTYAAATIGAFAVVHLLESQRGNDRLSSLRGLFQSSPVTSLCFGIFIFSLAGIPPLAGFFGKFYLFAEALEPASGVLGLFWLVGLAVITSVVSFYYYLKVLKQVFVMEALPDTRSFATPPFTQFILVLIASGILLLGCFPHWFTGLIEPAMKAHGF